MKFRHVICASLLMSTGTMCTEASAGYYLMEGKAAVCKALIDNLPTTNTTDPVTDWPEVLPPPFSNIIWRSLDVRQQIELAVDVLLGFMMRNKIDNEKIRQRYRGVVEGDLAENNLRLYSFDFDIDGDGRPEKVLRYQRAVPGGSMSYHYVKEPNSWIFPAEKASAMFIFSRSLFYVSFSLNSNPDIGPQATVYSVASLHGLFGVDEQCKLGFKGD